MVHDRYLNNMAIIHSLEVLARKHPDMRFHQLLWAAGLIEKRSDENRGQVLRGKSRHMEAND